MASGKGTKIYKKLQSGAGEGQGAADTITSSRVPPRGTQLHQRGGPGRVPPGLQFHAGQAKAPCLFFLLPKPFLTSPSNPPPGDLSSTQSPRQEAVLWAEPGPKLPCSGPKFSPGREAEAVAGVVCGD